MEYRHISKADAEQMLNKWRTDSIIPAVEHDYLDLRDELLKAYKEVEASVGQDNLYLIDMEYGLRVYEILNAGKGFTLRIASDDGVWRYLAVAVIPDIIEKRWGKDNDDHSWAKPSRNWLRQIWWYVYLSWNKTVEDTRRILKDNSTDEILNLVERSGRGGYNVPLFRAIMKKYSRVPQKVRQEKRVRVRSKTGKEKNRTLFRTIMVMNTAFTQTIEPGLFKRKEEGYVEWLFGQAGLEDTDYNEA